MLNKTFILPILFISSISSAQQLNYELLEKCAYNLGEAQKLIDKKLYKSALYSLNHTVETLKPALPAGFQPKNNEVRQARILYARASQTIGTLYHHGNLEEENITPQQRLFPERKKAIIYFKQALEYKNYIPEQVGLINLNLGVLHLYENQLPLSAVEELFTQAKEESIKTHSPLLQAESCYWLGHLYTHYYPNHLIAGLELYKDSIFLSKQHENPILYAKALHELYQLFYYWGCQDKTLYERAALLLCKLCQIQDNNPAVRIHKKTEKDLADFCVRYQLNFDVIKMQSNQTPWF